MQGLLHALRRGLAERRWPLVAAAVGMALVLPSLGSGLQYDDYVHRHILTGSTSPDLERGPLELFEFLDGDPVRTRRLVDLGLLPWWTLDTVRMAFWRPLTALTHWLDYRLWPDHPALMHLQSILWYGALVGAVAMLYRRIDPAPWAAGLAALLYAIDGAHGFPAGWLSNRNAIIAACFAVLALMAHDRWRRERWRLGAVAGPALLLAALLSAEAAIAVGGYLLAHAAFLDRGRPQSRVLALVPYGLVAGAWHVAHHLFGYGARSAAPIYISPVEEPGRFAAALLERAPLLLLGQWLSPLELAEHVVSRGPAFRLGGVAALAALLVVFWPLLRRSATARFWALGHSLALLPLCAAYPHERHLLMVGIGGTGLLAEFLAGLLGRASWAAPHRARRLPAMVVAALLVGVHAIVAPLRLPLTSRAHEGYNRLLRDLSDSIPVDVRPDRTVVIVKALDAAHATFMNLYRAGSGAAMPGRIYRLGPGLASMEASRPDAHTLVIRSPAGWFPHTHELLLRGEGFGMTAGQRVRLTGLTVEVLRVSGNGQPVEVAFRFDVPLEDASLTWLSWQPVLDTAHPTRLDLLLRVLGHPDAGFPRSIAYAPFVPPAIGETRALP